MRDRVVGTCGNCGGRVLNYSVLHMVGPWPPGVCESCGAEEEDGSMTTPDPFDLDHIDKLRAAATPGRWHRSHDSDAEHPCNCGQIWSDHRLLFLPNRDEDFGPTNYVNDGRCVVAEHNAYPAMAAEIRRLRAELRRMAEWYDAIADTIPRDAAGPHFGVVEWVRQLVANARALAIEELECLIRDDATWISDTEVVRVRGIRERIAALRAGDAAKETARVQQARREGFEAGLRELREDLAEIEKTLKPEIQDKQVDDNGN